MLGVTMKLHWVEGFKRTGVRVSGLDETIYPSLVKDGIEIERGWDIWMGYYLLSGNERTDHYLLTLATPSGAARNS